MTNHLMTQSARVLAVASVLIAAPVVQALADTTPGWYVSGGVGAVVAEDSTAHTSAGNRSIDYDPGYSYLASGGYAWGTGLRLEGEVFHSRVDVNGVQGATNAGGHLSNTDLFANALYDFKTGMMFTPYIGAGLGVSFVTADAIGPLPTSGNLDENNKTALAYQGIVGAAAQLDRNWAVTADYRYIDTFEPKLKLSTGGHSRTTDAQHNIMLGLRYSFGNEPAPVMAELSPPQVSSVPTAMATPAAVPQTYMVFFDFDKLALTAEARKVLASAVAEYNRGGVVRVVVTGHADSVGTNPYNARLSRHRADVVRAALIKLGIKAKAITAKGVGKKELLVPTADQVRESHNRRAEIVFSR